MGDYVSIGSGVALFAVSVMVMKTYWPRPRQERDAAFFLGIAIFTGFLSDALNTAWWQIVVGGLTKVGVVEYGPLRSIGLYLDGGLKGLAAVAGVLHLMAVHRKLPEDEQKRHYWFDMPWYPRRLLGFNSWRNR